MHLFVVLNPVAGRSNATEVRQALARHFDPASWQVTIHETKAEEPVDEAVRASIEQGVDIVVAAGGDGTLSAVVDGLANSNVPLGILPTGTTNVVAQELNIPLSLEKACKLLAGKHKLRAIDGRLTSLVGDATAVSARSGVHGDLDDATREELEALGYLAE